MNNRGITFLQLMVTLGLVALLAAVLVPKFLLRPPVQGR